MAGRIKALIKLQIMGGAANPSPPVGPALGQQGVNIMDFCKAFNAETQTPEFKGKPIPVVITVFENRSFKFKKKSPPASYFLKETLGIKSGSKVPNKDKVGRITRAQLEKIAKEKMVDLNANDLNAAVRIIAGTARSMGIDVEEEV